MSDVPITTPDPAPAGLGGDAAVTSDSTKKGTKKGTKKAPDTTPDPAATGVTRTNKDEETPDQPGDSDYSATKKHEQSPRPAAVAVGGTKKHEKTKKARPLPSRDMFVGILGTAVDLLDPTTEADPVAIYASLLAAFGAMLNAGPHLRVGNTTHPLLIWPLIFGRTGDGRKGESWSGTRRVLAAVDPTFTADNIEAGLSSGEGLIARIKDPADGDNDPPTRRGEFTGTHDKRLLVIEPEFGSLMARAKREGNTLASVLRDAWDGRPLSVLTKVRTRASASHIAVIGHVVPKEFRLRQAEADLAGGTYNRFLPLFVERSKRLPITDGIGDDALHDLARTLRGALADARRIGRISLDDAATQLWTNHLYDEFIETGEDDTPATEFTRRAAPYCLRIAGLHAALAGRASVTHDDLTAAAALVRYAIASAHYVLDKTTGDPRLDRIRRAIAAAGPAGLSRTDVANLFGRNLTRPLLDELLLRLDADPEFDTVTATTGGRPSTRYRHTPTQQPVALNSSLFVPAPDREQEPAA